MPKAIQVLMNGATAYATSADFCRIFSEEMNTLCFESGRGRGHGAPSSCTPYG
jgi:hypothetical protein